MQLKLVVALVCVFALVFVQVEADDDEENDNDEPLDFEPMKPREIEHYGLKCIPGQTVIRMEAKQPEHKEENDDGDGSEESYRRTHMNWKGDKTKEDCKICTCSIEGKDEDCLGRPARNLNECLKLARITEEMKSNIPFGHERVLSNRIRRYGGKYADAVQADAEMMWDFNLFDLLWHKDEIPYDRDDRCTRGISFYTNNEQTNTSTIDVPDNLDSLLHYDSDSCYYCVCHTSGHHVRCIARDPWYCDFYRSIRTESGRNKHMKEDYAKLFQQDRPGYFRSLSFRLRRTMDWGLVDMIDIAQKGLKQPDCIPYLSEYNDCSEYTNCRGCNQCRCNAEGQWVCYKKKNTCDDEGDTFDDGTEDNVVGGIMQQLADKEKEERLKRPSPYQYAPLPEKRKSTVEDPVIDVGEEAVRQIQEVFRLKRALKEDNETYIPIQFHHTVDEINEDTLKNSNVTGTLGVRKVDPKPSGSRRAGVVVNSTSNPLQIEYNNHPSIYSNHITDNKIESAHNANQYEDLITDKMHKLVNYTQDVKDKQLSKLVVNELKPGSETIGDPNAPVASNITFTPEKDTLTAMAYIAGNLLNRLWNLEKDSNGDSIETDNMKNQKISDLLDLFQEPLTYRQETFLKDALEHLSEAVNKNKVNKQFSLCEKVEEIKTDLVNSGIVQTETKPSKESPRSDKRESYAANALNKMNEILDLIKKYEGVQADLHGIKHARVSSLRQVSNVTAPSEDDKSSLNQFGSLLEKITNLLIPKGSRVKNKIRTENILSKKAYDLDDDIKKAFYINTDTMKLTSADKLILDYINKMQKAPCPLSKLPEDVSIKYKQSDILLNLSEFFKIKSYSDLMKVINPSTIPPPTTTLIDLVRRRTINETEADIGNSESNKTSSENNKTSSINEKLKLHLKAIVNDLIEIQNAKGKEIKSSDINIADALPCLFKMLNQDKDKPLKTMKQYTNSAILNKIKTVLEAVKNDIKNVPQSRRSMNTGPLPKSAVVWERLVRNLNQNPKSKPTRRFFTVIKPKSYKDVKNIIDNLGINRSDTYKSVALNKDVPAADRLMFLRTLAIENGNYANALGSLIDLNRDKKIPNNEFEDLTEFVDKATAKINLNVDVMNNLDKPKMRFDIHSNTHQGEKTNLNRISDINGNIRISSTEAMNQLIKDRVNQYLKMKESEKTTDDMGYKIAQTILSYLERGSDKLARELFKILIDTSKKEKPTPAPYPVFRSSDSIEKRPKTADLINKQWESEDLFLKSLDSQWASVQAA